MTGGAIACASDLNNLLTLQSQILIIGHTDVGKMFGMRWVVFIFVRSFDAQVSAGPAFAARQNRPTELLADSSSDTGRRAEWSFRKDSSPPFWTWFIENPRGCGRAGTDY